MSVPLCLPCLGINCDNPPDLASGIDGALYSQLDYSFTVQCPPFCFCPPGLFPQTISILASTIPPVIPPIPEPGAPIILRLQGCTALITRTLDSTATQADIIAAAQSMQAEWAGQQALCNALLVQGVNCNTGSGSISVCNDGQTICCPGFGPVTIAAGVRCQDLNITGLTQDQINSAIAAIKASLNALAIDGVCPFFKVGCSITETFLSAGSTVTLVGHNQSATLTFDSSTFQIRDNNGSFFNSLHATIAPNTSLVLQSIQGPFTAQPFTIWYNGYIIFTDPNGNGGLSRQVDVFVECVPPAPPC
jgi:hypothetical protein